MDIKKEAKLSVLKNMKKMATEMMGNGLKDGMDKKMAKVTVAASNPADLKKGLEKAQEIVEKDPAKELEEEVMEASEEESPEEEMAEGEEKSIEDCETPEEIDALIAKLEEKKKALASK
jgi:hypothetical protein